MDLLERAEIRRLPKKYRPLGAWGYFWYSILFSLPIIGLISLIACSLSDKNISRRSFARYYWLSLLIVVIFCVIIAAIVVVLMATNVITQDMIDSFLSGTGLTV